MTELGVSDVRVFVPAKDFEVSKDFYISLGWTLEWTDDKLALLEIADQRIYLQNYYAKQWAENFMLHLIVPDAQVCYDYASSLVDSGRFPGVRVGGPKHEPYGAVVTYVWDPSGVLLHFAQWDA